jgi:hypothetical protein
MHAHDGHAWTFDPNIRWELLAVILLDRGSGGLQRLSNV